jgi:hypothetical protein
MSGPRHAQLSSKAAAFLSKHGRRQAGPDSREAGSAVYTAPI